MTYREGPQRVNGSQRRAVKKRCRRVESSKDARTPGGGIVRECFGTRPPRRRNWLTGVRLHGAGAGRKGNGSRGEGSGGASRKISKKWTLRGRKGS